MSLEYLRSNMQKEKELFMRIEALFTESQGLQLGDKRKLTYDQAIKSSLDQIKILNNSLPHLLENVSLIKKMPSTKANTKNKDIISLEHESLDGKSMIALYKKDKQAYLKSLQISEDSLKRIRKGKNEAVFKVENFKKPNFYISLSNRFFSKLSYKLISKGYFSELDRSLKRANFNILIHSYVSLIFFTTFISLFLGILISMFFMFFGIKLEYPFIYALSGDVFYRVMRVLGIIVVIPILTFLTVYIYPKIEKSSIQSNIDYELPFATIQMSAIASSDIEPSNIFRIMALGKEYPFVRNEARKLMNQINLYGYDLVTAMRNVAAASPSKSFGDLLNGISTTIRSGGSLSKYLDKKSESSMFEYQLKREKAIKSAETFMDIYISLVIAAPMLMMMLLIMISISQIGLNIPIYVLAIMVVGVVAMINFVFLVFLHLNQKKI